MKIASALVFAMMATIGSARASDQQRIGSWVLNCPEHDPCVLRLSKLFMEKGGIAADLEVQAVGKSLVPVLVLRGLSSELVMAASLAGRVDASVRFGRGVREPLECAPGSIFYICAPAPVVAARLAAALPNARSVTVRVVASVTGMKPLPAQERSSDLSGTVEALGRLRAVGPSQVPGPLAAVASRSPGALMGMADKALRAAGYSNGVADLQGLLAKYRGK